MADQGASEGRYLRAGDLVNGAEAWAYMVTPDNEQKELFMIKNLKADIKLEVSDITTLGHRARQRKITGWDGTGSMDIYDCSTYFRKLMNDYIHGGTFPYVNIVATNYDPQSTVGKQVVHLNKVLIDQASAVAIDVNSAVLDDTINFSFADYEIQDYFTDPDIRPDTKPVGNQ